MREYLVEGVSSALTGLPIYHAEIRVLNADTTPAQLYSDAGVTPLGQPVLTDGLGSAAFFVADGTYTLVIADPGGANARSFPNTEIFEDARNVSVPIGEPGLVLPSAGARMGRVLGFDSAGAPIAVANDVIAVAEDVARAEAAATAADADRVQTGLDRISAGTSAGTAATQASIATSAAATTALLVQANPATPTVPPSGSSSGGQYWAVDTTSQNLVLYLNTAGVGAPVSPTVTTVLKAFFDLYGPRLMSPLLRTAASGTPAYVFADAAKTSLLGQVNTDGKWYIDLHTSSPAYSLITTKIATAMLAGGFLPLSPLARLVGATGGSPSTDKILVCERDSAGAPLYGAAGDGSFWQSKYDSRIKKTVDASDRLANGPVPIVSSGNVVLLYGTGQRTVWSSGTASNPRFGTAGGLIFNDKIKGLDCGLSMAIDGTVRAIQRDTTYDIYTGAGSSAMIGAFAPTAADLIPIYPTKTLTLTGGPVLSDAVTRSGAAALINLAEVTTGSFASYFAASMYAKTSPYRSAMKIAVVGHGVNGSTTTASIDVGSTAGNDIIASVARIVTLSGVAAGTDAACRVVAHILHHGDAVINASYAANLATYQASFEAGIQAATGQVERLPFFCSCSATQQKFAAGGTPVANYNGYLGTAAITRSVADGGNANFFPTVADYILTFTDNQHPASGMTGQDLRAEYEAMAVDVVMNQGRDFVAARVKLPATWTITSTYIDIPCEVQVAPLLVDTLLCTDPGGDAGAIDANGKGFTLTDSNSRRITGITIVGGGTTIRVAISGALGTGRNLEYAATNGTSGLSGRATGPRGCVHDSTATMSRDGTTRLYNPLWPFTFAF